MRGVAARYPAFDDEAGRAVTLVQRVNLCRERHQKQPALDADSAAMLGLTALVGLQSRGMPIAPPRDARLEAVRERGRTWFGRPLGQLELSCAQCHDLHAGRSLAGVRIPQAHPTGVPVTLPRSASEWLTEISLACKCTRRAATRSSQAYTS